MKTVLPVLALAALALCGCPNSNPTTCNYDSDCGSESKRCCNATCVDITKDVNNCGACGAVCPAVHGTATCEARVCKLTCEPNRGNCDNDVSNGCEADLGNDAKNCGACAKACFSKNAKGVCGGGECGQGACDMGYADCNKASADGCEVNTQDDVMNCGVCGKACSVANGNPKCFGGTCAVDSCKPNFGNCDNDPTNGCESSLGSDAMHCGACDVACADGESCIAGACKKAGLIFFGGAADQTSSTSVADVTRFDPVSKAFEAISPATPNGSPEPRTGHVAIWDTGSPRMVTFGGQTASGTSDPTVWSLDFSVDPPVWNKVVTNANSPAGRAGSCIGYDRESRVVYAFGGQDDQGNGHNDLWKLNLADNTWTTVHGDLTGAEDPPALIAPACAFIAESHTLVLFGGLDNNSGSTTNTLYTYVTTDASPAWSIAKVGNPPASRFFAAFFEGATPLAMFGGADFDFVNFSINNYNDVQVLDLTADPPTWTEESPDGDPNVPAQRAGTAVGVSGGHRYLFGGAPLDFGGGGGTSYDDVWEWDPATKKWTELASVGAMGAPAGKVGATMVIPQ